MTTCGTGNYFWQHDGFGNEGVAHASVMWLVFFPHFNVQQRN